MANRFPLVFDATGKSLEELPTGDNLDLTGSSVVNAVNITASGALQVGTITANSVSVNGTQLATVATTNDYNDLTNKPDLFSGDYNDLTNKPVSMGADWDDITNKPVIATKISQLVNDTNFVTNAQVSITPSQVTGLANIASSGSFTDLSDVPNFVTNEQIVGGTLTVEVSNTGDLQGSVFADDSTIMLDHINNELSAFKVKTDVIESRDFSIVATDDISIQTPQFLLLQTQSFEINNNNSGTVISDQDRIRFQGTVDFGLATVTGLELTSLIGDLKGSVFSDDSAVIVDSVNNVLTANTVNGNLVTATALTTDSISSTTGMTITSTGGIQLLPNGIFNVPNASSVTFAATQGISLTATDDLTLTSSSGVVDFPEGTTVDFTGAAVTGLESLLDGELKGSVFADDSTLLVDGINGTLHGNGINVDNGTYNVKVDSTGAFLQWSSQDGVSVTSSGTTIGGTGGVALVGALGATIVIGDGSAGNITIGSGTNTVSIKNSSSLDISDLTSINFANSTITGLEGSSISYTPAVPANWNGAVPTTIQEAIDRIVAANAADGGTLP